MAPIKLCVFDFDGTLVNTIADLAESGNHALGKNGFSTFPTDAYYQFVGSGVKNLIKRALADSAYTEKEFDAILSCFNAHYNLHFADKSAPYPQVAELLNELKTKGVACSILTNKPALFISSLTEKMFPAYPFDVVMGSSPDFPLKPAPDSLLHIMRHAAATAEETLYIGDSDVDILTGKAAAAKTIGCAWGFRGKDELIAAGADHIVNNALEILNFIH